MERTISSLAAYLPLRMSTISVLSIIKAFEVQDRQIPSHLCKTPSIFLSLCLQEDSYLPLSSLALSLSLVCPKTQSLSLFFLSLIQDVYFMLLSFRGLMTLNCLIPLMSWGARDWRSARFLSKSEHARDEIGRGEAFWWIYCLVGISSRFFTEATEDKREDGLLSSREKLSRGTLDRKEEYWKFGVKSCKLQLGRVEKRRVGGNLQK